MDNDYNDLTPNRSMRPGWGVIACFGLLMVALGAGVDRVMMHSADDDWVAVAPEPTDLDEACAPRVEESSALLNQANGRLGELTELVDTKQQEVDALEREISESKQASTEQTKRLAAVRSELAELRTQLRTAETDRLNLSATVSVQRTTLEAQSMQINSQLQRIDTQLAAINLAQSDALEASWLAFGRAAQIEICEKGNRKTLGRCREVVRARLAPIEDDYRACVSAGAAKPSVAEAASTTERLPQFAQWIGKSDRVTKGWYALLCDPTLPEAGARADGAAMIDLE